MRRFLLIAALAALLPGVARADSDVPSLTAGTSLTSAVMYLANAGGTNNNKLGFTTSVFDIATGALTLKAGAVTDAMLASTFLKTSALGTGVATALGINTGSAGAFVKNNGDALSGTFSGSPTFSGTGITFSGAASGTQATCLGLTSGGVLATSAGACGTGGGGGSGTVTSVTFTGDGVVDSATPSSAVTSSGTVTATIKTQTANTVLVGPASGGALAPTFRALVPLDLGGSAASHGVPVDVAGTTTWKVVPDCTDTGGNHINYTQSTDAFSCGTSGGGGGSGTVNAGTTPQAAYYASSTTAVSGASGVTFPGAVAIAVGSPTGSSPGTGVVDVATGYQVNGVPVAQVVAGTSQTVSAAQWAAGTTFVVTSGSQTLTLPASSTLSANGGIVIQTVGQSVALAPNGSDTINGSNTTATISSGLSSVVTTNAAGAVYATPTAVGAGNVTAAGTLASGGIVIGQGTEAVATASDITFATGILTLGVNTSEIGGVKMFGGTSGNLTLEPSAVAGTNLIATFPANTGTVAELNLAQSWTAAQTLTAAAPQLILGVNTSTLGSIKMFGNTSGDLTIRPPAVAGTASVITFPGGTTDFSGTSGFVQQATTGAAFTVAALPAASTSVAGIAKLHNVPVATGWVATVDPNKAVIATVHQASRISAIIGRVSDATGSAATVAIYKAASGTACSAGTILHSGTFDANGTANTNQTLTLVGGATDDLADGDSLCLVTTGTTAWTTGTGVGGVTVYLAPI